MERGGYRWIYVDGVSDDGDDAIVVIAMIGAPFSPFYARARAAAGAHGADPLDHVALNVAVYGRRASAWCLTERVGAARERDAIAVGASTMRWRGDALVTTIDERTAPLPGRVRGEVRVHPIACTDARFALDPRGLHAWTPIAPIARIEVALEEPRVRWRGVGYVDGNDGDAPLDEALRGWTWSRAALDDGRVAIAYDAIARDGQEARIARIVDRRGRLHEAPPLDAHALPRTAWRVDRTARADRGEAPRVARSLEDAPFYARALVDARIDGARGRGVHEVLSLDRFRAGWVRFLLPFRMRRG